MGKIVTNNKNSSYPTQKLRSSPIPISFVSFNWKDDKCINCGDKYAWTLLCYQKYCKNCLSRYISDTTDNNTYLDVTICTTNLECSEHENKKLITQDIQDWCENCSIVSCFKQIPTNYFCLNHIL